MLPSEPLRPWAWATAWSASCVCRALAELPQPFGQVGAHGHGELPQGIFVAVQAPAQLVHVQRAGGGRCVRGARWLAAASHRGRVHRPAGRTQQRLVHRLHQGLRTHRFGRVAVHAGRQTGLTVAVHGVRRHRHDGRMRQAASDFLVTDQAGGFQSVGSRHLDVHQHDVHATQGPLLDRLLPVARQPHAAAQAPEQLVHQQLVDRVVLGHQHTQARKTVTRLRDLVQLDRRAQRTGVDSRFAQGQGHREGAALTEGALQLHAARPSAGPGASRSPSPSPLPP